MTKAAREIVLVTGLSGAGKASILRVLEDLGFETVDNPPIAILESLVGDGVLPLAAGIDARTRDFDAAAVLRVLERLRLRSDINVSLIFATAEDEALLRRYTESRRRHPLAPGGPMGSRVLDGSAREKALLEALRMIEGRFAPDAAAGLAVSVLSFAYPKGLPREADLVFDVRFLRNPHYDPVLRPMTGQAAPVAAFIEADPDFSAFWQRLRDFLELLLPRYAAEGKKYFTIAVGCTGGKHRSVLVAERLAGHLRATGWRVDLAHRELKINMGQASSAGLNAAPGQEALSQVS
jgi:UPF0042 nucleotide-binding protein